MKKLTALLIALILLCSTFVGCDDDSPTVNGGQNNSDDAEFNDVIKDYDKEETIDGFTVKGKGYYYKGCDTPPGSIDLSEGEVLILNVKNNTETHYSITLNMTYLDENGEEIKKDSKYIEQFPSKYQRYVLFRPGTDYDSYVCEVTKTEYTGEIYVDRISIGFDNIRKGKLRVKGWQEEGGLTYYPTLWLYTLVKFEAPVPKLGVSYVTILFDNTGEIYLMCTGGGRYFGEPGQDTAASGFAFKSIRDKDAKIEIPDELKGDISVIFTPSAYSIIQ